MNDGQAKDFMPPGHCCNCKYWSKARFNELKLNHYSGYAVCEAVGYMGDSKKTMNIIDMEGSPYPLPTKVALVVLYTHSCTTYEAV